MEKHSVQSITLEKLQSTLATFIEHHPEIKDKQVYFDGLSITGDIVVHYDFVELL